jgi:hypothetical protein
MGEEQKAIAEWVDDLYAESDKKVFEILQKIAALAIEQNDL